jgi:hypothetical protein
VNQKQLCDGKQIQVDLFHAMIESAKSRPMLSRISRGIPFFYSIAFAKLVKNKQATRKFLVEIHHDRSVRLQLIILDFSQVK